MQIEIKVPSVGESVSEAILAEWFKTDGELVGKDEPLFVIETDKVTLEVVAEAAGTLKILVPANETVPVGTLVGTIDTETAAQPAAVAQPTVSMPVSADDLPPSVRRLVAEKQVDISKIRGSGPAGRITKGDVLLFLESVPAAAEAPIQPVEMGEPLEAAVRKPMSPMRRRIAARLLEAKQNTAMLTTFNEIDMGRCMAIRAQYKEAFKKRHDVSLGFMSFFTRACVEALKEIPGINAAIEGDDIVYYNHYHIGIAIGTGKGLVVPVIRNAERLGFAGIEGAIVDYVHKVKENRLELSDLEGGTFTITNGGVFGSLLSTPILNPPQSGILGMHKIEKRPVVVDDQIVIRPMMYVALSYDHRIVDGREAVTFLKRVKEFVEDPERMMMEI